MRTEGAERIFWAKTPTLNMHGAADMRFPIGQAQELYIGLRKNNVPVEMLVYPRENPGFTEPLHILDKMRRESQWFLKYIGQPERLAGGRARGRTGSVTNKRLKSHAGGKYPLMSD